MKRTVPLLITAIVGFVLIVSFFIPEYQEWGEITAVWFDILAAIAFILGGGNLLKVHLKKISDRVQQFGHAHFGFARHAQDGNQRPGCNGADDQPR